MRRGRRRTSSGASPRPTAATRASASCERTASARRTASTWSPRCGGRAMLLPFDERGEGPAVVLLHAGVADRTMWSEHLGPLAASVHRVLAPDLPGFGEAPVAPGQQAPWSDVLQTMDAAGIDRAAVVGSSFGGAVALRVAAVAPERVTALALVSAPAPGVEPSADLQAAWEAEGEALGRGDVEAAVAAGVDAWTLP